MRKIIKKIWKNAVRRWGVVQVIATIVAVVAVVFCGTLSVTITALRISESKKMPVVHEPQANDNSISDSSISEVKFIEAFSPQTNSENFNNNDDDMKKILEEISSSSSFEESSDSDDSEVGTIDGEIFYAPSGYQSTRMSYMDYRTITDTSSKQYMLQSWYGSTDPTTGIRLVGGRYCIALGQEITSEKGQFVDVVLENGLRLHCVLADCKRYCDTVGESGYVGADGGMVEFVVDEDYLPEDVILMGSNEAQFDWAWQSPVKYVIVYDNGIYIN